MSIEQGRDLAEDNLKDLGSRGFHDAEGITIHISPRMPALIYAGPYRTGRKYRVVGMYDYDSEVLSTAPGVSVAMHKKGVRIATKEVKAKPRILASAGGSAEALAAAILKALPTLYRVGSIHSFSEGEL